MGTELVNKQTLNGLISRFNECEKVYLLALLKGYSELEAHDIASAMGSGIDRYLIEPDFAKMRGYFLDNGWNDKKEVDREWKELLSAHYIEMMLMEGIKELGKDSRNRDILKEATKCALAHKAKVDISNESYDEMILKRHRKVD
jgi:hypothetical protein